MVNTNIDDKKFLQKIQELNDRGMNYKTMAEHMKIPYYTIIKRKQNAERRTGIKINYTNLGRRTPLSKKEIDKAKKMRDKGYSLQKIADNINRSVAAIHIALKKNEKENKVTKKNYKECKTDGCNGFVASGNHWFCEQCELKNSKVDDTAPDFFYAGGIEGNHGKRTGPNGTSRSRGHV